MRVRPPESDKAPGPAGEADAGRLAGETETWRLAGAVAHELRTPLATMGLHLEGLARQIGTQLAPGAATVPSATTPSVRQMQARLAALRGELQRAHATIDLVLAALRPGPIDTSTFATHSLRACVHSALQRYPFAPGQRAQVDAQGCDDLLFFGAPQLLELVLFNLLDNAFHALAAAAQPAPAITLRTAQRDDHPLLLVSDNGAGVPQHALARIFDARYTTKPHGTGLGLAFCRQAMRSFGGEITCASKPGQGALITLSLARVPRLS